ncbi:hypothetical protein [Demequina aestuarii]|uniref:hypothetical protein n=1 Tax=Demequina aestuarii TaxID=327095 RepID=UPI0007834BC5|nr:hypothetical protein [Demequina aestuarii]
MLPRFVSARRHRTPVAARVIALAGLVAVMAALAFGSLHTTADAAPLSAGAAHAVADATHADATHADADAGCVTCGEHDGGVMAACLMVLVIVVMMSSPRGMPRSWEIRIPARERRWAPRILHRPMTPSLNALCICRT